MWTQKSSIRLSLVCTWLFMAVLACGLVMARPMALAYIHWGHKPESLLPVLLTAFYICAVPAAVLLWRLRALLTAIDCGKVFVPENVASLRIISWCCFAAAVVCLGCGWIYLPFFFVAVAASFMGLILRVVKNVFMQAMELKQENDYTI